MASSRSPQLAIPKLAPRVGKNKYFLHSPVTFYHAYHPDSNPPTAMSFFGEVIEINDFGTEAVRRAVTSTEDYHAILAQAEAERRATSYQQRVAEWRVGKLAESMATDHHTDVLIAERAADIALTAAGDDPNIYVLISQAMNDDRGLSAFAVKEHILRAVLSGLDTYHLAHGTTPADALTPYAHNYLSAIHPRVNRAFKEECEDRAAKHIRDLAIAAAAKDDAANADSGAADKGKGKGKATTNEATDEAGGDGKSTFRSIGRRARNLFASDKPTVMNTSINDAASAGKAAASRSTAKYTAISTFMSDPASDPHQPAKSDPSHPTSTTDNPLISDNGSSKFSDKGSDSAFNNDGPNLTYEEAKRRKAMAVKKAEQRAMFAHLVANYEEESLACEGLANYLKRKMYEGIDRASRWAMDKLKIPIPEDREFAELLEALDIDPADATDRGL